MISYDADKKGLQMIKLYSTDRVEKEFGCNVEIETESCLVLLDYIDTGCGMVCVDENEALTMGATVAQIIEASNIANATRTASFK